MRVTPPTPAEGTKSDAEIRVHGLLREIELPGCTAIHSLTVARHQYKRWGEIDFLVVGPAGITAIEVKGGRVANIGGIWEFTDRYGESRRKAESPMRQVERGLMELRNWLSERLPEPELRDVSFGWTVLLPDIGFAYSSPEWTPQSVGDRDDCRDAAALGRWLRAAATHWQERNGIRQPLSPDAVKRLLELLRPEFEILPSLSTKVAAALSASDRITSEQLSILDAVLENDRVVVTGGAGTGKTIMAAELARRIHRTESGVSQAVLVPHQVSAMPYRSVLPVGCEVFVWPDLPAVPVEMLIVDEAQDLMTDDGVFAIDRSVRGGIADGRWAVFMDKNAQAGLRGLFDPEAYGLLVSARPTVVRLTRNLRNTHQITQYVQATTGADVGIPGAAVGPEVRTRLIQDDSQFPREVSKLLSELRRAEATAEQVVVLTWSDPSSVADSIESGPWRVLAVEGAVEAAATSGVVRVLQPEQFQGLEATHVIIGPVPFDPSEAGRARCYIAETRARADLIFVTTMDAADQISTMDGRFG